MDTTPPELALLQRRRTLKRLASGASLLGLSGCQAWAQTSGHASSTDTLDAWRAMSRVGYGPSPSLISALQAAPDARAWALAQVDLAFVASQTKPSISPDLAHFNTPLPELFAGVVRERQVRTQNRGEPLADVNADANRRLDFSSPLDPAHFNRAVQLETAAWRLGSCSRPEEENPLLARMTEFWFNHLNVFVGKGQVRPFTGHYLVNVARAHALGKFEDLLLASARHPAMLYYLDQVQSVAEGSPGPQGRTRGLNENYARELMELHTLGVHGGYQQADVRALARVLTGWTVGPEELSGFRFNPRLHDNGRKVIMGQTYPSHLFGGGEQEGVEAIRLLARHPATAQRVCLRLARYFVADQPPPELVARLSQLFLDTQGDLRVVMKWLLQAPEFWQPEHRLFKTPMDFACSVLTVRQALMPTSPEASADPPDRRPLTLALGFLAGAGQPLHGWQTPDGYPFDAATWLAPEALTRRADFALSLTRQTPELEFLSPFLSDATRAALSRARPALRAGLALASPDFMYK
jgi:uncharacterized protein (DUF1800 family)